MIQKTDRTGNVIGIRLLKATIIFVVLTLIFHCRPQERWHFEESIDLPDISPLGIATEQNFLWVSDPQHNRLYKLDLQGKSLSVYNDIQRPMHLEIHQSTVYYPEYLTDRIWANEVAGRREIPLTETPDGPAAISLSGERLAIADFYNHRIILQHPQGVTIIGRKGHGPGELYYPTDVEIAANKIYVADAYNNRVQVFDYENNLLQIIADKDSLQTATGLTVDHDQVFVTDFEGNRIMVYGLQGNLIQVIRGNLLNPADIAVSGDKMYVANYKGKSISIYRK